MKEILLTSSVLILALAALRRVLRGRLDPRLQYALWLLVALRLLIPGSLFPSPVSVAGTAEEVRAAIQTQAPAPSPAPSAPIQGLPAEGVTAQPTPPALAVTHTPAVIPDAVTVRQVDWPDLLWKGGMALTAALLAGSNLHFYFTLRKKRRRLEGGDLPVPCSAPVYLVEDLPSPCLFGLPRPAVYVNAAALAPGRLSHILVHEETHRRHGDHLWALLRGLCLTIYWFDPLVWWAAALSRRDCELACDHSVLRRLGEEERLPYGQTLLSMLAPGRPLAGLLRTATTMTAEKRTMKERLELIAKRPRMLAVTLIAVLVVVAGVVAVTFGGKPAEVAPPKAPPAALDLSEDQPVDPALPTAEGRRKGTYTFLVIVPAPYTGYADTVLLTSYNMAGDDINCMSIPKDTIVGAWQDPKKLSDYYFAGGDQDILRDHVRDLTGILPDYTIILQPKGVEALVDALGGVEFYVPSDMDYEDPAQNLSVHLEKGRRTISGADAMAMLRYRCAADGDLSRIKLRHSLLRDLTAQCLASREADLFSAVKAAAKHTTVYNGPADFPDLNLGNLLWLAREARDGKMTDVQFFTMPCTPGEYEDETYLFADRFGMADLADQYLNPYTRPITYEDLTLVYLSEGGYLTSTDRTQANTYYSQAEHLLFWFQDGASTEEWLPLVGKLDWRSLDHFKRPGDFFDPCAEIQSAISAYITERGADMTFAEYHDILSATEGLDGAYTEGYSALVWQLYETDPVIFAQVVTESLDANARKFVIDCLVQEGNARNEVQLSTAEVTRRLEEWAHGETISLGIATVEGDDAEADQAFSYGEQYKAAMRAWHPGIFSYGSPEALAATARDDWSLAGIQSAIQTALAPTLIGTPLEDELTGVTITYSFHYPEELSAGMVLEVPYIARYTSGHTVTDPTGENEVHLSGVTAPLTAQVTLAGNGSYVPPDKAFLAGQALRDQLRACVQVPEQEVPAGSVFPVSQSIQDAVNANLEAAGLAELYHITSCSIAGPWIEVVALGPGVTQTVSCSLTLSPLEQGSGLEVDPFLFAFTFTTVE